MSLISNTKEFHCPKCHSNSSYHAIQDENFLTRFFSSIFSNENQSDKIQCETCGEAFPKSVLINASIFNNYQRTLLKIMSLTTLADGKIMPEEIDAMKDIMKRLTDVEMSNEEINKTIRELMIEEIDIYSYINQIAPTLSDHGKNQIIRAAIMIAAADGNIDNTEISFIHHLGEGIGFKESVVDQMIHDTLKSVY